MLPVATNLQLQANLPRSLLFFFAENIPAGLHCIFSIKKKSMQTNQSRGELIQPSSSSPGTVSIHSFHQLATSALAGSGKEDTPKIMLFSANLNMISWYAPLVIYYPTCDPPSFINGKTSTLLARKSSLLGELRCQRFLLKPLVWVSTAKNIAQLLQLHLPVGTVPWSDAVPIDL